MSVAMALSVTAAPELLDFVASGDSDEQEVAIGLLAELASTAYGQDGVMLGEIIRDTGGVVSTAAVDCTPFLVWVHGSKQCACHVHTGAPIAAACHRLGADQAWHAAAAGQSML